MYIYRSLQILEECLCSGEYYCNVLKLQMYKAKFNNKKIKLYLLKIIVQTTLFGIGNVAICSFNNNFFCCKFRLEKVNCLSVKAKMFKNYGTG